MKAALIADTIARPVKNRIKGRLPPITPMATSLVISERLNFFTSGQRRVKINSPINRRATIPFFRKVKVVGSLTTVTAILDTKLATPEMMAVLKAREMANFSWDDKGIY
ncbi:MAG: hypothetical protein UW94_C0005G0094 [Parcubacteria group bacterium GW2011_GWA2_45_14]|nr:MAG: hypothetical protein UW94_C0005G0094 [Parcubacteria group bacterium GW2011_GWA2_45_14]